MAKFTTYFDEDIESEEITGPMGVMPPETPDPAIPEPHRTRTFETPESATDADITALERLSRGPAIPHARPASARTRQVRDPITASLHRRGLHDRAAGRETYAGGEDAFGRGDYESAGASFRKARDFAEAGTPERGAIEEAIARTTRASVGSVPAAEEEALARISRPTPPARPDRSALGALERRFERGGRLGRMQAMRRPRPARSALGNLEGQLEAGKRLGNLRVTTPQDPPPTPTGTPTSGAAPSDGFLTPLEQASEAARAEPLGTLADRETPPEVPDELPGERTYLTPRERDAALAQYHARYSGAAPPRGGPSRGRAPGDASLPVPALAGPGGESREQEVGLPPAPPPPPPPMAEVTETEESITEDTPENEVRVREAAEMIATDNSAPPARQEEVDGDPLESARRRAYITSGIMDIVGGIIAGFAASQGAVDPRAIAQMLANSERPLERFREMAQAAREARQQAEASRRRGVEESRAARREERAQEQHTVSMDQAQRSAQAAATTASMRDPESDASGASRSQYVDALVGLGIDREVAQERAAGRSGVEIESRSAEVEELREQRERYFRDRRGHRPSGRGWSRRLRDLGYGATRRRNARPSGAPPSAGGARRRPRPPTPPTARPSVVPGAAPEVPVPEEWTAETETETVVTETPREYADRLQAEAAAMPLGSSRRARAERSAREAETRVYDEEDRAALSRVSRGLPSAGRPQSRISGYRRVVGGPRISTAQVGDGREFQTESRRIQRLARRMARLSREVGAMDAAGAAVGENSPEVYEANRTHNALSAAIRAAENMGVPQRFELEIVNRAIPPLTSWRGLLGAEDAYSGLANDSVESERRGLALMGYTPERPIRVRIGDRVRHMTPSTIREMRDRNYRRNRYRDDPNLGIEVLGGE